jgi:hypothetical protein
MIKKIIKIFWRNADEEIFNSDGRLYLRRWFIIKSNRFNIYLHNFHSSDEDRALHDHPWWSIGMILKGQYLEHMPQNHTMWVYQKNRDEKVVVRHKFEPVYRAPHHIHRIELIDNKPVWTLFITGPKRRKWGFWCPQGFRRDKDFFDKGCGDD